MKNKIIFAIVSIHFSVVLLYNIAQCTKSHWDLYNKKHAQYENINSSVLTVLRVLAPFYTYQGITGTNTAYGFYAPQVCGHLEPFFQVYKGNEKLLDYYNIALNNQESMIRLEAVFGENLERLEEIVTEGSKNDITGKIEYKFLDIKMHALATKVLNLVGEGDRIEAGLYFYHTESIKAFYDQQKPLNPTYHKTMSYDYQIK